MKRRPMHYERDLDTLLELHRRSWEINFPGRRFDAWVFTASLESSARRDEVFIYEDDDAIVAWLWLAFPGRDGAHVRHIQVVEDHWGEGIGRRVMLDAIATARARGRRVLTLVVTKSNARAMALYRSLTFTVERDEGERQRMWLDITRSYLLPDEAESEGSHNT